MSMQRKRQRPNQWDAPMNWKDQVMVNAVNRLDARSRRITRLGGTKRPAYDGQAFHSFQRVFQDIKLGCADASVTGAELDDSITSASTDITNVLVGNPTDPTTAGLTGRAYGFSVNLKSLPETSEFTNLFEQYRIAKVEYTFIPSLNNVTLNPVYGGNDGAPESNEILPGGNASASLIGARGAIPLIFIATDNDDNSTADIKTLAAMMQRPYKMYRGDRMFKWTIKNPSVNTALETGTGSSFVASGKVSPWIQATTTTTANGTTVYGGDYIKHFGCKMIIHNAPKNGLWSMKTFVKVWVDCKHVK